MKTYICLFLLLFLPGLLAGCAKGSDTLDGLPVSQVLVLHEEGQVPLPSALARELNLMLTETQKGSFAPYDGDLDAPGTLVFLGPDETDGQSQVIFRLISQVGQFPLLVRQEAASDGTVTQTAAELAPTFSTPQYLRWRGEVEEAIWDWEADRLAALAVPDFSDPQAIEDILAAMKIRQAAGPFTWHVQEDPVPGIVITLAEPSATYRTQQFMEACAPLFLELVESAQAFHYTFSEGASGSLEVFSANSKGVMDFSGLYAVAQRHALLPSPLFCPRFTVTEALSPTPGFVYYDTANVIFYGDRFSVTLNNEPNPFDGSGGIQMEAEIPHPVYTPYSLGSMTVTDAAGVRRDLTEGCSVKLVYFIYDENGQDTGFRLNILDNNLYLVCSSQAEGIEHIFRLCPDPVPDNRGEKTSQG